MNNKFRIASVSIILIAIGILVYFIWNIIQDYNEGSFACSVNDCVVIKTRCNDEICYYPKFNLTCNGEERSEVMSEVQTELSSLTFCKNHTIGSSYEVRNNKGLLTELLFIIFTIR